MFPFLPMSLAAQEPGEAARGAADPVVRAVLFYSPTCPHCIEVMEVHLPPLLERYGDRLQIASINTTTPPGAALYRSMVAALAVPPARQGVPALLTGSRVLVGSMEIPTELPGIIEAGLAAGGVDWPDVDMIREAIAMGGDGGVELGVSEHPSAEGSVADRLAADPSGNLAAVVLLVLMMAALIAVGRTMTGRGFAVPASPPRAVPLLALAGLGIAAYLAFIEMTGAEAVCGPFGDCNAVQQSEYARLFGFVPVGLVGVGGYAAILVAWMFGLSGSDERKDQVRRAITGMALVATLYSVYLTFLEPFVIGATCIWCLGSAAVATLLLLSVTGTMGRKPAVGRAERRRRARRSSAG
jgi:uncharacterized membrane protein